MQLVYRVNTKARIRGKAFLFLFLDNTPRLSLYRPVGRSNPSNRYTIKVSEVFIRRDD